MKKENYQSPKVEIINLGSEGVLCASCFTNPADTNQMIETWGEENFTWE